MSQVRHSLPLVASLVLVAACNTAAEGGSSATDSATDSDSSSSSGGDSTSTTSGGGSTSTSTTSGGSESASMSGGGVCVPGMSVGCACQDGGNGAQICLPDGSGYGPCECAGTSATTTGPDPTTTSTTADPTTTTGVDTTGTTGVDTACQETVTFEMMPDEATLSGDWQLGMSMLGEGQIVQIQGGTDGSVLFEPMIPCDDTWYIWVRALDQGSDDSYFATLDGEPNPPAIFEGDCTGGGNGYKWARLNWRDANAGPCEYIEDPWAPMWSTGVHAIEFSFRESQAMGRILLTNDANLMP